MENCKGQQNLRRKKMTKQLTGKRDDTPLHSAARAGDVEAVRQILGECADRAALDDLLCMQNQAGETAFFVAVEYGYVDLAKELLNFVDVACAGIKAKNGYDAFHIATKQGDVDIVKDLLEAIPELANTVDFANTTPLHTAANQGYTEIVNLILETDVGLLRIAKSNGKTALHSAARNGHLEVVIALTSKDPAIVMITDNKGQTALHMAVKGQTLEVVEELLKFGAPLVNAVDKKGNTALHIATRKGRSETVKKLLQVKGINTKIVNRSAETALDTAEKSSQPEIASILRQAGVDYARNISPPNAARELKQSVSDIKHEVHSQIEQEIQTRKGVQRIASGLKKLNADGLNNAINSTTVVAVLIATVAFAAIFTLPGQYVDDPSNVTPKLALGAAFISPQPLFQVFLIFDSSALFISLAVVVVQTSVVVIENKAKKRLMAVINKLMWLACVLISVAFIALSFIVVGGDSIWLAITVAVIGTIVMVTTLGILGFLVVRHRIESSNHKSLRRSSMSLSKTYSFSPASNSEYVPTDHKTIYAL
ncbi:ankyrin repeat-containing protein At5g02620 [Nymphaea colorata]|nr:ankyrin repeat-containing protein At5g02620 [Nymphaea colorata]